MRRSLANFLPLAILLLLSSCSYQNRNYLFNTPGTGTGAPVTVYSKSKDTSNTQYRHRIKVGDRLYIRFLNNYDIGGSSGEAATSGANTALSGSSERGYLVNYDSTVVLPLIGRINLIGLTRLDAAKKLEEEYKRFIVNPIIDLDIASLSVTVLGEVNNPGKVLLSKENTTLIDVIALAGGIKDSGKKKNIKIIRGTEVIIINLKRIEILNRPEIIMHDNDIVYVEPYRFKATSEPFVSAQAGLGIMTTALQTLILVTQFYLIYNR